MTLTQPNNNKIPFTPENLVKYNVLTQDKVDILWGRNRKEKRLITRFLFIAGKQTGKTFPVIVKMIWNMCNNPYYNGFGFRKHANKASEQMLSYFSYAVRILESLNFDLGARFKKSQSKFYRMNKSKVDMNVNQQFKTGSLEDPTGSTDGGAPSNGGFYGDKLFDEPIDKNDVGNPDKIPTLAEWKEMTEDIIDSNINRFNDMFVATQVKDKTKEINTTDYFTMNDWGDHPLAIEAQENHNLDKYIEYIFGFDIMPHLCDLEFWQAKFEDNEFRRRIRKNNILEIQYEHSPGEWTSITRMTKWANPSFHTPKKDKKLEMDIFKALVQGNINKLAIHLGLRYEGFVNSDMLVYSTKNFNNKTHEQALEENWIPRAINYSVDVDTSRVFTITPTIYYVKYGSTPYPGIQPKVSDEGILLDRQIELSAYGTGDSGEFNEIYVKQISAIITQHYKKLNFPLRAIVSIDDKRKWYLLNIKKAQPIPGARYKTFEQHGDFDINNRQEYMELGFKNGILWNHPHNKLLEQDIKACIKSDFNKYARKTTGRDNYLDRIDSAENGFVPFYTAILRSKIKIKENKEK